MKRAYRYGAILAAIPVLVAVWAFGIEPGLLTVNRVTIQNGKWPPTHRDMKVAVIGDLHVGAPHAGLDMVRRVVATVNEERPDLVLLLGDYVIHGVLGGEFVPPEAIAAELRELSAPLGVYAVLGNHDWWYDGNRVRRALEAVHIPVLENDAVRLGLGSAVFWIAGMADDTTRTPQPRETVGRVPGGEPVIAFAHDPYTFFGVPERVVITIAAHTHGGQVYLPLLGAPITPGRAPRRFAYGHIRESGKDLYTTSGVGTSILPVRLNMPPEVAFITLESRPAAGSQN